MQNKVILTGIVLALLTLFWIPNIPIHNANASTCSSSASAASEGSSSSTSSGSGSCAAISGSSGNSGQRSLSETGGISHCGSFTATGPKPFMDFQSGNSVSCKTP